MSVNKHARRLLSSGSGVVDAAGGSGFVSLALSFRGVKSTVVDARESVGCLPRRDRKALRKAARRRPGEVVKFNVLRAWFGEKPAGADLEFDGGQDDVRIPVCSSDSDDGLHGYTVLVQEMTCNIPGCAPIETVVAMLKRGANRNGKILKPIAEVTEEDVAQLLVEMIGDPTGAAAAASAVAGVAVSPRQRVKPSKRLSGCCRRQKKTKDDLS